MKMKSSLLVIALMIVILSPCKKDPELFVSIVDDNFLNALIERGVDVNGDSIISQDEAEIITFLDISSENVTDISGIEAFVNLDTLICMFNKLTHLDVSHNVALKLF
jgi:trimeric autotransporter adhesin